MINDCINRVDTFLQQFISHTSIPAETIRAAVNYSLFSGGKRIRPILVYLVGDLLEINLSILDTIAAAVELTHCYSLIHDDLPAMDNDDFRRGKPSSHKAFDEATAILVGDGMQALAIEILLTHLPHLVHCEQITAIALELVKAVGLSGMVSGQSLDLSELAQPSIDSERLKEIHLLKTGRLISASIEMVLKAYTTEFEAHKIALRTYASHIGLVFQMQDDYLDCYAPTELLGKGRSSDLANQKTTFAALYTQNQLKEIIKEHFQAALDALKIFDQKAYKLINFTQEIQSRTTLS